MRRADKSKARRQESGSPTAARQSNELLLEEKGFSAPGKAQLAGTDNNSGTVVGMMQPTEKSGWRRLPRRRSSPEAICGPVGTRLPVDECTALLALPASQLI
ncbi:hypothetical protein ElyMa_004544300 [Elysia marginata]|uniref:Uncharacterized protein n=1 Tax=Elysia marginata TaxID=1093978 RepID=A0AAV4HPI0_9GAST|nr:hypothetical protein ElyMa_004544300 [Elysia marginata]